MLGSGFALGGAEIKQLKQGLYLGVGGGEGGEGGWLLGSGFALGGAEIKQLKQGLHLEVGGGEGGEGRGGCERMRY